VQIAMLRGLGLAARYVSGYIRTFPPEDGTALRGADASHAWISAWCGPDLGWIDLDPTNDLVVSDEHVVLAVGRDYADLSPIRGVVLGGGPHSVDVAVQLTPI
jgi:transglutaminase-like putative cysteine protease